MGRQPRMGETVYYVLRPEDVHVITNRRQIDQLLNPDGPAQKRWRRVYAGQPLPMYVTGTMTDEGGDTISGQVMLDGDVIVWIQRATQATSMSIPPGCWYWPPE